MSMSAHCLLILFALLFLSGIFEHSQVGARIALLPRRLHEGEEDFFDGGETSERKRRGTLILPYFHYPRSLAKRGPELFIPYMEA
ncbi:unnamed protein product [Rodentolepis nana]|uniref:Uncharacterized protein n=1 Tax=Rodentolepis nana TaxID=102285 RepID=A0A0R3TGR0_RODNA|nr:unnamed protein product [Rodentolepis nana]